MRALHAVTAILFFFATGLVQAAEEVRLGVNWMYYGSQAEFAYAKIQGVLQGSKYRSGHNFPETGPPLLTVWWLMGTVTSPIDQQGCNPNTLASQTISGTTGSFISGMLEHLHALSAYTSPSLISVQRYQLPRWTAYFNNFGVQDRKAAIRQTFLGDGENPSILNSEMLKEPPVPSWCSAL